MIGAGKTSLFNVLAGRARSKGRIEVSGDVILGDAKIAPDHNRKIRSMFAFVAQEDALHEPSTPRQCLQFSAKLRLPKNTPDKNIAMLVDKYIEELGLTSCCDTVVGGNLTKGISGGEKEECLLAWSSSPSRPLFFLMNRQVVWIPSRQNR
jgi:ABC-type multidrug transport system ATPase subunit